MRSSPLRRRPELGGGKLFVQRIFSAKFMLPNRVYTVISQELAQLLDLLAGSAVAAARFEPPAVRLHVSRAAAPDLVSGG